VRRITLPRGAGEGGMNHEHASRFSAQNGFIVGSVFLAVIFSFWSRQLYAVANNSPQFLLKLGEYFLQIALIVLVGAAVKAFVEWRDAVQLDRNYDAALRAEFLRRLRAVHMTVLNARDLMWAHRTARTWGEQSRRLLADIPVLQEIQEDLLVAPKLFGTKQQAILEGMEGMARYLEDCRVEYVAKHESVEADREAGKPLKDTVKAGQMSWADGFMSGAATLPAAYHDNLMNAKVPMREAVMAGTGRPARSPPVAPAGS
jgi:hypothetical protein